MGGLICILISAIFILSSLGKLIDLSASSLPIGQLFELSQTNAKILILSLSIFEAGLVILIWQQHISRILLVVPLALLSVTLFGYWRGLDCGCFGSLPFLSQFSFGSHLLLLGGMFLGLYYLTTTSKTEKAPAQTTDGQAAKTPRWIGLAALVMMASAFLTLPFISSDSRASQSLSSNIVDRAMVEAAIASHNAIIIDARPDFQYVLGYLPDAINIPYDSNNLPELIEQHALKSQPLIVYCSSAHCNAAELLAEKLRGLGCEKVSVYSGGWEEWEKGRLGERVSGGKGDGENEP